MVDNSGWFKRCVMSLSFKERRARELGKYRKRVSEIENMEPDEIDFEYMILKTEYENKKSILNIFIISIVLAVLMNVWKYFFIFIEKALQYAVLFKGIEIAKVSFSIAAIIAVFITSLIVVILTIFMKEIYRLQKELMIIETVRDKQFIE